MVIGQRRVPKAAWPERFDLVGLGENLRGLRMVLLGGALFQVPRPGACREHPTLTLKHVHNALEFADLREGAPYKITVEGDTVSPLAHVTTNAAVKGQIEQDPLVRAAFEEMVATATSAHHVEHVLNAMLIEPLWAGGQAVEAGNDPEKAQSIYYRRLKKLNRDSAFRRKLTRQFRADHFVFE